MSSLHRRNKYFDSGCVQLKVTVVARQFYGSYQYLSLSIHLSGTSRSTRLAIHYQIQYMQAHIRPTTSDLIQRKDKQENFALTQLFCFHKEHLPRYNNLSLVFNFQSNPPFHQLLTCSGRGGERERDPVLRNLFTSKCTQLACCLSTEMSKFTYQ